MELIALEGTQAPGADSGVTFSKLYTPVLNGAGQVAFLGDLKGPGDEDSTSRGIWATDSDGVLRLLVQFGDQIDISTDPSIQELRTIASLDLVSIHPLIGGGEDGLSMSFNDAGQLAFHASFTDGSEGVFVATVPEPASLLMLGSAGVWVMLSRRRVTGAGGLGMPRNGLSLIDR